MSNTLQIKRGSGTPTTSNLAEYELAYDYTNDKLYIHDPTNSSGQEIVEVGGGGGGNSTATSSFLTGDSLVSYDGYIMTRGIVNENETGSTPAAIVFGNGATYGNDNLSLITAGATALFINSSGNVGIGGTAANRDLQINGTGIIRLKDADGDPGLDFGDAEMQLRYRTASDKLQVYSYGTTSNVLTIQKSNGYVGIGTESPSQTLEVAGAIKATGTGGFTIGNVAGLDRIQNSSNSFSFLTDGNAYAGMTFGTVTAGTWQGTAIDATYIGSLPASKITSGAFDVDRLPTAAVTNGDIDNVSTADAIYDFVTGQGYLTSVPNHSASLITSGTLNNARLNTDMQLSAAAPRYKLQETGVTNTPVWWMIADGGNYSIRLNNTGTYPLQIITNGENNAVSSLNLGYNTTVQGTVTANSLDISGNVDVDGTLETDALTINGTTSVAFTTSDHSKLDGIESGATADQTKSDIDALGINATTVDGYDSSRFFRRQGASSATVGPGWMTVATNTSGRQAGEILVTDGDSSDHGFIRIHWLRSYQDSNFTVINCGGHQNRITGVRVLSQDSDNTYGEKVLQVYVTVSSSYDVKIFRMGDDSHYGDHTVHTPTIENSITGYSVHGNQLENLDTYGFAHEEGILAGGNIEADRMRTGTGTAAFPAYSFEADTNTGIFRAGSDDMRFVAGGDARFSANGNGLDLSVNSATKIVHNTSSTRDKYRVWSASAYAIGMQNSFTFGGLDSDYAMTFQMSNTASRGFWFGDNNHGQAGGAMAVTTEGKLTVAHSMRLGYGETDQTTPGSTFTMDLYGANGLKINTTGDQQLRFVRSGGNDISIEHDTSQIYFYNRATSKAMFLMSNSGSAIMGYNSNPSLEIRNTATSTGSGPSLVFGHDQSGTNSTGRISTYLTDGSNANRSAVVRHWYRQAGTEHLGLQLGDSSGYLRLYRKGDTGDYLEIIRNTDHSQFRIQSGGNYHKFMTDSGYANIGPQNASWNHFITDRPGNYFDKKIAVNTGIIESYDENLDLRRAQSTNDRIVIEADQHSHYVNGSKRLEVKSTGIVAQGKSETSTYFQCNQNGETLRRYVSSWTNATTHDVILNSYATTLGDYVYLKASGNSTTDQGIIVVADNYIFLGRDNLTTGGLDNSATAPISDVYCRIDSSGNALFDGDVVAYSTTIASDARLKENVKDLNYGLKDVLNIRPVSFDWKDKRDGQHDIGVIAQEIEKIIPEVVVEVDTLNSEDTHKTVDYAKLTSVLIKAVQEQQQEINELKEKLNG